LSRESVLTGPLPALDHKQGCGVVATASLTESTYPDIAEMIASRAERGMQLYLSKRQLIIRTGEEFYLVPGSGRRSYKVRYGGPVESCDCTDFGVHRDELACKHLTAVALLYATRRRRPSTVRKLAGAIGVELQGFIEADRCSGRRVDG
jgi:hypothetical protein